MELENQSVPLVIPVSKPKKEKLKERYRKFYEKNISDRGIDEKIAAVNDTRLDIENLVGTGLVGFYASALLPLCPVIAKFSKKGRKIIFDKIMGLVSGKGINSFDSSNIDGVLSEENKETISSVINDVVGRFGKEGINPEVDDVSVSKGRR